MAARRERLSCSGRWSADRLPGTFSLGAAKRWTFTITRRLGATASDCLGIVHGRELPAVADEHIIFLIKENHTFDNLFGLMPHVDGARYAWEGKRHVRMAITPIQLWQDLYHIKDAPSEAVNGGKMSRFYEFAESKQHGIDVADWSMSAVKSPTTGRTPPDLP